MVQISIGKQDRFDRGSSGFGMRSPLGINKLRTQIWRGIYQHPLVPIGAQGDATLGPHFKKSAPCTIALATSAIPLRNAAAGSRSQELHNHRLALLSCRRKNIPFAAAQIDHWVGFAFQGFLSIWRVVVI